MGSFCGSLRDCLAGEHGSRALEERADYTPDYSIWVQLVKDYFKWFGWSGIADRSIEKRAKSKPPHANPRMGHPRRGHTSKKQEKSKSAPLLRRAGLKTAGMRHPKAFSELRGGHPASSIRKRPICPRSPVSSSLKIVRWYNSSRINTSRIDSHDRACYAQIGKIPLSSLLWTTVHCGPSKVRVPWSHW